MKDDRVYLENIIDVIEEIERFTVGGQSDEKTQRAVERNLEIIGEAARNISQNFQDLHKNIPWRQMVGMRNKLIHDYLGVDVTMVWQTVKNDLPKLKQNIISILKNGDR